jgi:hypothetical protein
MHEVEHANNQAILNKEFKKIEERELENKINEYNKQKAQREAERVAEENAVRAEKEREVQKLRDMQQRAQDRQADIDALRAKRAFEEGERLAREKERKEIIYK